MTDSIDDDLDRLFAEGQRDNKRSAMNYARRCEAMEAEWRAGNREARTENVSAPQEPLLFDGLADAIEARTGQRVGGLMLAAELWPIKLRPCPAPKMMRAVWNARQRAALLRYAPELVEVPT